MNLKVNSVQFSIVMKRLLPRDNTQCPPHGKDLVCNEDNSFLIGEAAGFISTNLREGMNYAHDSVEFIKSVRLRAEPNMNLPYHTATRNLNCKLYG